MKDGVIRRFVKAVARVCFSFDLSVTRGIRRARGERPYRLGGSCAMCAGCCEAPSVQTHWWTFRLRTLRWVFLAWHKHVNGFELVGVERRSRTFVFRCSHFDASTRRCDSYSSRPGMCRDYPRLLLWEGEPPFLRGCGFRAVAVNAERVAELLDEESLPPEKLAELKEKLRVGK